MRPTRYFLLILITVAVALHGSDAGAQARAEKVRLVYSAIGSSQSPLWIGYEAGIFRKHGLDAELLYVGGGSRAAQVVLSGEVPIAMFTGAAVISADLAGPRKGGGKRSRCAHSPSPGLRVARGRMAKLD